MPRNQWFLRRQWRRGAQGRGVAGRSPCRNSDNLHAVGVDREMEVRAEQAADFLSHRDLVCPVGKAKMQDARTRGALVGLHDGVCHAVYGT
jgi:hypothetical protein